MMNNKGVTLIELLIVIVVIGIISAFAVPAVGSFLESAQKQAVYQDAVAVRNAAANYCAQPTTTCAVDETLSLSDLEDYLDGFDSTNYVVDDTGTGDETIATLSSGSWQITLESIGDAAGDWEWVTTTDPINGDSTDVSADN